MQHSSVQRVSTPPFALPAARLCGNGTSRGSQRLLCPGWDSQSARRADSSFVGDHPLNRAGASSWSLFQAAPIPRRFVALSLTGFWTNIAAIWSVLHNQSDCR